MTEEGKILAKGESLLQPAARNDVNRAIVKNETRNGSALVFFHEYRMTLDGPIPWRQTPTAFRLRGRPQSQPDRRRREWACRSRDSRRRT